MKLHPSFGRFIVLMSVLSCLGLGSLGYRASRHPTPTTKTSPTLTPTGFPQLSPLPTPGETWECSVIVVGGSLGGVAAASHAMQSGAKTCLIEVSPWVGGQISSQAVSAVDESLAMRAKENYSTSWSNFKQLIAQQAVNLPAWTNSSPRQVKDINSCWVGKLCFTPIAGAAAAEKLLEVSSKKAPGSRWGSGIAFKGASFDSTSKQITAIYAVRRIPRDRNYTPSGRLSQELTSWYSWSSDSVFEKVPLRLQAPPNKKLIVIDATDTGELVGWAGIPYRLGSESRATTGEPHAAPKDNPECTQAFTFPFVLAIHDDGGSSRKQLANIQPGISVAEHRRDFSLEGFPMFAGRSFFNYRRLVSLTRNNPFVATPSAGDMTLVNWNRGNDWSWMNPPLILTEKLLASSGQRQNWMGGISLDALKEAENHALLFSQWLMETQAKKNFPLAHLSGADKPMGTLSGLSMMPYIREGRRILGRKAYGQNQFIMREQDLRTDLRGGRNFKTTAVALTHYDIDLHGCRYRNWHPSYEATSAPAREFVIRPTFIPLESLIPQQIDNLLIGGKSIAVTHIVNSVTRIHYSEWSVGAAAGATAGWLHQKNMAPTDIIPQKLMPQLQQNLKKQELRLSW